ncbi:MAG: hypothetical protein BAJALOKI1v1_530010 [Promethearchaeota archaeon]|nr:MAG: hypothetical protein BAJALOKI1v1_530010 [Candidatus Lokiarchaeota archaeon]
MQTIHTELNRVIVARVYPDEDLIESITQVVLQSDITSGSINVIGALKKYTLGYFDIKKKEYKLHSFEEDVELISCMGNIAFKDGKPIIHLHCIVGREDYSVMGGHLGQPSIISVTGEVIIHETTTPLLRENDPRFNLSLLKLNK